MTKPSNPASKDETRALVPASDAHSQGSAQPLRESSQHAQARPALEAKLTNGDQAVPADAAVASSRFVPADLSLAHQQDCQHHQHAVTAGSHRVELVLAADAVTAAEAEHAKQPTALAVARGDLSTAHQQVASQPPPAQPWMLTPGIDWTGSSEPDVADVVASMTASGLPAIAWAEIMALQALPEQSSQTPSLALPGAVELPRTSPRNQQGAAILSSQQQLTPAVPSPQEQPPSAIPSAPKAVSNQQLDGQDDQSTCRAIHPAIGAQSSPDVKADQISAAAPFKELPQYPGNSQSITVDPDIQAALQKELAVRLAKCDYSRGLLRPSSTAHSPDSDAPPFPAVAENQGAGNAMQHIAPGSMLFVTSIKLPLHTYLYTHDLPPANPPCPAA